VPASLPPGALPPLMRGQVARARARLAWWAGDPDTGERESRTAEAVFRELGAPFWLAVGLLERAEWLSSVGRATDGASPLSEAREIFERLGATPWLHRAAGLSLVEAKAVR